MPSEVINQVNQIGIAEGHTYLLTFYCRKSNPVGDDNTNISVLYEAPGITGVD